MQLTLPESSHRCAEFTLSRGMAAEKVNELQWSGHEKHIVLSTGWLPGKALIK